MLRAYTPHKPYIPSCANGFTLVELTVAIGLLLGISAMVLSSSLVSKYVFKKDMVRTRLNQNLRSGMDFIGTNVRLAGENLPATFPSILVVDGAAGAPDELIIRRNLLDEILKLCTGVLAGNATTTLDFALPGNISGCIYKDNLHNYSAWRNYRLAEGGTVNGFLFDVSTNSGEFFEHVNEQNTGTSLNIQVTPYGTWSNNYDEDGTSIYILEEWHFRLPSNTLQLIEDGNSGSPLNVIDGVDNFQVVIHMQDGSFQTSFTDSDNWTQVQSLEVRLDGSDSSSGVLLNQAYTSRFVPRNILSN